MDRFTIGAEFKRRQTTMTAVSLAAGLSRAAISVSFLRPFERAERALVTFLGIPPQIIFPTRYDAHGNRTVQQGRPPRRKRLINTSARGGRAGQ